MSSEGPPNSPGGRSKARPVLLLALAVAVHLGAASALLVPAVASMDELTYVMMTGAWAAGSGFVVENGYSERPSPELVVAWLRPSNGRLVSQYPDLWPALNASAWTFAGSASLYWAQALLLPVLVAATWLLARELFGDIRLASASAVVLVACTFLYEYSLAAWPHLATATFVTVGAWLSARAFGRGRPWFAVAAGLVAGSAIGLRLDAVFAIIGTLLVLGLARPLPRRELTAYLAGLAPPLFLLALANHLKFGASLPLSYGRTAGSADAASYLPLAGAALAAVAALGATRSATAGRLLRRASWPLSLVALAGVGAAVLAYPPARDFAARLVDGSLQLAVDLRHRPLIPERALFRLPGGALVYLGGLKKALLQSLPWLPVLVLAATRLARGGKDRHALAALAVPPAAAFAAYAWFAWHGGQSLNLRYFVTFLPMLAILGAWSARELLGRTDAPAVRLAALGALASAVLVLPLRPWRPELLGTTRLEALLLDAPLALAAGVLLVALANSISATAASLARRPAALLLGAAFAWAGLVEATYDLPLVRRHRAMNEDVGTRIARVVPQGALLLADAHEVNAVAIEARAAILAIPRLDGYRDLRALVSHHLSRGRQVVACLDSSHAKALRASGILDPFEVTPVAQVDRFALLRIGPRPVPAPAAAASVLSPPPSPSSR